MVSKNVLLGSGLPPEIEQEPVHGPPMLRTPTWRHHRTLPSRLVKNDIELDSLDSAVWKDHPGKVRLLPGFESLYEEEERDGADRIPVIESKIDLSEISTLKEKKK